MKAMTENRFFVSWIVAVAMFMETLDITIVAVAIPAMSRAFHVSPLSLKLALTSYLLSLAVFIPISGWVADKWGTKRVFVSAILLFTLGSLACAMSYQLDQMVLARLFQGLGGAMMLPVGRIIVLKTFEKTELIRATNHMTMPALLGPALGPLLGGVIVHYLSWRWIFLVNIPMGLIGMWLTYRYMPNYQERETPPLDWIGFLLLGAGLVGFSLFLEYWSDALIAPGLTMSCFVTSLLLLVLYVLWSAKRSHPIIAVHLFKIKTYTKGIFGSFLSRLTISSMPFLLPLLFQVGLGWSPLISGTLVAFQAVGMIVGKSLIARTLKYCGFKNYLIINSLLLALMVISFSFIDKDTPYWLIILQVFIFGMSVSTQYTSVNLLCYSGISSKDISASTCLYSIIVQYSGSIAIAVAGLIVGYFAGEASTSQHLPVSALSHTFLAMAGFVLLAELMFFTLKASDGAGIG